MNQSPIDKILESRRPTVAPAALAEKENDKFYSILVGEPVQEQYLELRFRIGLKACFSYSDLSWFTYDPDSGKLDLEFGAMFVSVAGRGLGGKIFDGIKHKRVSWLKESDSEMQDNQENEVFIAEISVTLPSTGDDTAEAVH